MGVHHKYINFYNFLISFIAWIKIKIKLNIKHKKIKNKPHTVLILTARQVFELQNKLIS